MIGQASIAELMKVLLYFIYLVAQLSNQKNNNGAEEAE